MMKQVVNALTVSDDAGIAAATDAGPVVNVIPSVILEAETSIEEIGSLSKEEIFQDSVLQDMHDSVLQDMQEVAAEILQDSVLQEMQEAAALPPPDPTVSVAVS